MITISIVLNLIGAFFLYSIAPKNENVTSFTFLNAFKKNKKRVKIVSAFLLCIAFLLNIVSFGFVSGMLFWLFILSAVFCLVIILTPLKMVNYKSVAALLLICLMFEILIK